MSEKVKKVDFTETIAACDLELIDLMKICEYLRSFLTGHLHVNI